MASVSTSVPATPAFERLLLTGAAGGLGRVLRPRLKRLCRVLRASDIAAMDPAGDGEEVVVAPLEDAAAVQAIVAGVQAIVHLGGVSTEGPFEPILRANIVGLHNLYEAARRHDVGRVVFASSNHVTGFYRQDEVVSPLEPMRPDGHYGLSKASQNLSRFYFDRYGSETVCLRIARRSPSRRTAHAGHLAQLRRPRAPGRGSLTARWSATASLRPLGKHDALVGQHLRGPHRLSPAGQLGAVSRRARGEDAGARPGRSRRALPGRRLRQAGPLRVITPPASRILK